MSIAYFDTSALLKQYVTETGSGWVRAYLAQSPTFAIFTSSLTTVEATCAFTRRLRDGTLTPVLHTTVVEAFDYDIRHRHSLLDIVPLTLETACWLATRHLLRAYDAVQLATAWLLNQDLVVSGEAPLVFICADDHLLAVAQAEGLRTDNPNHHP